MLALKSLCTCSSQVVTRVSRVLLRPSSAATRCPIKANPVARCFRVLSDPTKMTTARSLTHYCVLRITIQRVLCQAKLNVDQPSLSLHMLEL